MRLVSTAPHLTETLCAIGAGDLLVGRTDVCDYPPETIKNLPVIGGFGTPWLEPLLAVRPTHVVKTILADPEMDNRLKRLSISVVHVPVTGLDDIPDSLLQLGELTGHTTEATGLATKIRTGLHDAGQESRALTHHPRVLLLLAPDTPITAGRHTFVSELLELAGGINVGRERQSDYYQVSLEWLISQNPDVILCLFETYTFDPCALFENQIGWKALTAVRQRRVYAVPDLNTVSRPGPRVLEGLAQVKRLLAWDARQCEQVPVKSVRLDPKE
jgi:iron complex transport system substrate-binding protein